jgi:hypothetical protein
MALWKRSDECRLTGLWNPSLYLATAFSACWRDCQATGQISADSLVLKRQRVNATGPSDPATPAHRGQDAAFAGQGLTVHKAVLRPAVGMVNQSRSGASSQFLPRDQTVPTHQPRRALPPGLMAPVDEIAVHPGTAISAVRQREGGSDMRKTDHVLLLAATGRAVLPSEKAALADVKRSTHPADREAGLLGPDEAEGHRRPAFAKTAAAFLGMSRSCFTTAFSRRGRFRSACRSTGASCRWSMPAARLHSGTPASVCSRFL